MRTALLLLALGAAAVSAENVRIFGDRAPHPAYPDEFVRTYVDMPKDHDGDTLPVAVGIQYRYGFTAKADELPFNFMADIPMDANMTLMFNYTAYENLGMKFPQVGKNPFKFSTWSYNLYGHPPLGVYDLEHYDARWFYETEDWWWSHRYNETSHGPCVGASPAIFYDANIPVPKDCYPGGNDSRVVSVGNFVWGQGTHLYDMNEEAWMSYTGTKVESKVWGIHGGGVRHHELMFSRSTALKKDYNECHDFSDLVPKYFETERAVPTKVCLVSGTNSFRVEMRNFKMVPGGCLDMRNTTLMGYFNTHALPFMGSPACQVPLRPK